MFFIRLPQLAVLAKILCLLMVVMCGAVPAMVRSVSLYSTCSSGNITVIDRKIMATASEDQIAQFQKLTTQSEDFSRKIYIFAEKSQKYICFNKHWKAIAVPKKKRDAMGGKCQFYETYNGPYLRYQSAADSTKNLGFNKHGRPIKGQGARQECYNFIKYNPSFSINDHNDYMTGNKLNDNPKKNIVLKNSHKSNNHHQQQPQLKNLKLQQKQQLKVQQKFPHHQIDEHKFKKNLLQNDEITRDTTTTHRHRHTNRLKVKEEYSGPRRRQNRRLLGRKY
ncbi:hypothetical protein HCN44_003003 [Aphidius gifuensis]|uniref:Odorant-binding protein n=1 Tax=Aphidius gifuensis TaxID=684658 RepID=A0A834XM44_APHGI|nr:uncharacterized protein LOC122859339 isoform X2 [Aphidius gifuensis]KAF7987241.1 hypothetical protein HCN44_003003 [Aphidius gifuensis]